MNFERFIPSASKQQMVKITITTVDTNLKYKMEISSSEADTLINKLTHDKFVKGNDTEDDTIHYINTRNIISIDIEEV